MRGPSVSEAIRPIPATAVLVDLRNFTPNLKAAGHDADGVNVFCRFLARFYGLCLDAGLRALPPGRRDHPPVYITSTGDGMLLVFYDEERHFLHGFLTALLLHHALGDTCDGYNAELGHPGIPRTSYGIGIESGKVGRIRATAQTASGMPLVDTFIGECINVASRVQELTKSLYQSHVIVAAEANALLCRHLFGEDYAALMADAVDPAHTDAERIAIQGRMNDLNRALCLSFIHQHQLRGVDRPLPLFRLSESAAKLGNPRFDALLRRLEGDAGHLDELLTALRAPASG